MIRPIPFLPVNSAGSTITRILFLLEDLLEAILDISESTDSSDSLSDEEDSLDSDSLSDEEDSLDADSLDDEDDEESREDMVEGSDSSEDNDAD
jgi:hypothetical protein